MCLLDGRKSGSPGCYMCDDLALCRQPPTCLDAMLGGVGVEIDHRLGTEVLVTDDMVVPNHEAHPA